MNLRRKLAFFMALNRYVEIIVRGVPPLSLIGAVENSVEYINAYGGLLQSGVPSGYTAVEYVQNATKTLVPTDFMPVGVTSVKVDLMTTVSLPSTATGRTFYIFQARETTATTIFGISGAQSSLAISGSGTNNAITSSITRTNGNKYRIVWEATNGTQTLTVDDLTAETTDTKTNTYTTIADVNSPMCLFGNAGTLDPSGTATEVNRIYQGAQVYYAKMWANGKLVLDLVPAKRNSDNAVGLYNRVNGQFLTASEGSLTAGNEIVPTPSDPMDIYCNNGKVSVLDHTNWNIITNPTSQTGQGMFINSDGKLQRANDRGAGVFIPITIGKQYTVLIDKKNTALGSIIRYGQSNNGDLPNSAEQLLDWYRGAIEDIMMISFTAKRPYFVMQLAANFVEAGGIDEAVEVIEAQGGDYTFLKYIEATGTQYIETGLSGAMRWVGAGQGTSDSAGSKCILSAKATTGSDIKGAVIWLGSRYASTVEGKKWALGGAGTGISISNVDTTAFAKYDVTFADDKFIGKINDEILGAVTNNWSINEWRIGTSFANQTGNPAYYFIGNIYRQQAYQNNVLVGDFIPAIRNSDSVVGMYDAVSGTFFTNAGTGVFVAGTPLGDGEVLKLTPSNDTAGVANLFAINTYKDVQEIITGTVKHKVNVYVLNGKETAWNDVVSSSSYAMPKTALGSDSNVLPNKSTDVICSHYSVAATESGTGVQDIIWVGGSNVNFKTKSTYATLQDWKDYLAAQYAAGTPVIVIVPFATEYTEPEPIAQTMQTVAGDNVLEIVQAGMSGLEVEATYTKSKY